MFDINFYIKSFPIYQDIVNGKKFKEDYVLKSLESFRSKSPIIYNIETTNACNMRCKMCPRTKMMTRDIETINPVTFEKIVRQIAPHSGKDWEKWERFVLTEYGIPKREMSENNFFLYIIPKVIQLHGYGDPLLDSNMPEYIKLLTEKGFESYFSCNPANIDIPLSVRMIENGLSYIKYSIESIDDNEFKRIRGNASNFSESFENIKHLLAIKKANNYKCTFIITMLDLNKSGQIEEYKKLVETFKGLDVYIYLKSEDQQWYRKDHHGTNALHWSEFCRHPWMSMTIKSNGEVAMCMEDFNNEIILGDANKDSLSEIWNGEKYTQFREDHYSLKPGVKCSERCDMKMIGSFFSK